MTEKIKLFYEATITPAGELTGKEWDVTIIGATDDPGSVIEFEGEKFIKSKNGRLYSSKAVAESTPLWDGVKVYDNHLTQAEFEQKQGMRSPVKEWLGTIVKPKWDEAKQQLRGIFKVVDDALAAKLKSAHEQGILPSIGLSIDTFPIIGREAQVEGARLPIIEGFKKILSVDLVGDPAAGGGFNRIIAAIQPEEDFTMTQDEIKALVKDTVANTVKTALAEALAAEAEALEAEEVEDVTEAEEDDSAQEMKMGKHPKGKDEEEEEEEDDAKEADTRDDVLTEAVRDIQLAQAKLTLDLRLSEAKLDEKHAEMVRGAFAGRLYEEKDLNKMIALAKEAQAKDDPTGRATEAANGRVIEVGMNEEDRLEVAFMQKVLDGRILRAVESEKDNEDFVKDALPRGYQAWLKAGKPDVGRYNRMSELVLALLGGKNPFWDELRFSEVSTLASVIKNTVNISVAADYSLQQRWYERLVTVEEVDTIDDATLVRLYGVDTLDVVNAGAAYTELALEDEEETAVFVKRGNYVPVHLEDLMKDKINFFRTIPRRLADTWYNTLSELTAAVFTTNTAAGPVLGTTGALFNATAATTAGGHANLLTAALSFTAFSAARTAMRKQTNRPLGVGRKLQINPAYLLVPEDLETTAMQIRNSEQITGSANNDVNPFYQQFEIIPVPDWTDANDWALVGDPRRFPAIYHIFPRGQRTPQIFTADSEVAGAMFTNDTLRFKVRMMTYRFSATYDCSPVADFRPLHKNNVT